MSNIINLVTNKMKNKLFIHNNGLIAKVYNKSEESPVVSISQADIENATTVSLNNSIYKDSPDIINAVSIPVSISSNIELDVITISHDGSNSIAQINPEAVKSENKYNIQIPVYNNNIDGNYSETIITVVDKNGNRTNQCIITSYEENPNFNAEEDISNTNPLHIYTGITSITIDENNDIVTSDGTIISEHVTIPTELSYTIYRKWYINHFVYEVAINDSTLDKYYKNKNYSMSLTVDNQKYDYLFVFGTTTISNISRMHCFNTFSLNQIDNDYTVKLDIKERSTGNIIITETLTVEKFPYEVTAEIIEDTDTYQKVEYSYDTTFTDYTSSWDYRKMYVNNQYVENDTTITYNKTDDEQIITAKIRALMDVQYPNAKRPTWYCRDTWLPETTITIPAKEQSDPADSATLTASAQAPSSSGPGYNVEVTYVIDGENVSTDSWTVECNGESSTDIRGSFLFDLEPGEHNLEVTATCGHGKTLTCPTSITVADPFADASVSATAHNGHDYGSDEYDSRDIIVEYSVSNTNYESYTVECYVDDVYKDSATYSEDCTDAQFIVEGVSNGNHTVQVIAKCDTHGTTVSTADTVTTYDPMTDASISAEVQESSVYDKSAVINYTIDNFPSKEDCDIKYKVNNGEWQTDYAYNEGSIDVYNLTYGNNKIYIKAACEHGTETNTVELDVALDVVGSLNASINAYGPNADVSYSIESDVTDGWTVTITTNGTADPDTIDSDNDTFYIIGLPVGESTITLNATHESGATCEWSDTVTIDDPALNATITAYDQSSSSQPGDAEISIEISGDYLDYETWTVECNGETTTIEGADSSNMIFYNVEPGDYTWDVKATCQDGIEINTTVDVHVYENEEA